MNEKQNIIPINALRFSAPIAVQENGEKPSSRPFGGIAYSGQAITNHFYWGKVIFDLPSISSPQNLPLLLGHDRNKIIGKTNAVKIKSDIQVIGQVFSDMKCGRDVAKLSDRGFPWQMSIHIEPGRIEKIREGLEKKVNGHKFTGPGHIFYNSKIREVSFTPTGFDDNTSAKIMENKVPSKITMPNISAKIINNNKAHKYQHERVRKNAMEDKKKFEKLKIMEGLEQENNQLKAELDKTKNSLRSLDKFQRFEKLSVIFQSFGRKLRESDCEAYFLMKKEFFDQIVLDLESIKPSIPEKSKLFSEEATSGIKEDDSLIHQMAIMP